MFRRKYKMKKNILLAIAILSFTTSFTQPKQAGNSANNSNGVVVANDTCKKIDDYLTMLEKEKNFSGGLLIIKDGNKIFCTGVTDGQIMSIKYPSHQTHWLQWVASQKLLLLLQ